MPVPSLPGPVVGPTTPTCRICGSAVYCGGVNCPPGNVSTLPNGYDGVSQVSTPYVSIWIRKSDGTIGPAPA